MNQGKSGVRAKEILNGDGNNIKKVSSDYRLRRFFLGGLFLSLPVTAYAQLDGEQEVLSNSLENVNISSSSNVLENNYVEELPTVYVNVGLATHVGLSTMLKENKGLVNVITRDDLDAIRPKKLEDLSSIVPGFSTVGFLNGGNRSIFIRGIGAMHDVNGTAVAVTVNGIPQDSLELQNPHITDDIESIEFYKTSQQVLFGKSGQAGAINIKTRKPTESGGAITFGIGNDGYQKAGVSYDYVPSNNFRIGGFFDFSKDTGWVKNTYLNRKFLGHNYKNYKLEGVWSPTQNTELSLSLFGSHTHDDGPLKTSIDPDSYRPINGSPDAMNPGESHEIPFWEIYQDTNPFWERDVKGGTFSFTHIFNNRIELSAITSYKKYKQDFITDLDATVQYDGYMSTLAQTYDYRYLTQNVQLKDETGEKFKWSLGASGYKNKFVINPGTYTNRYVADMSNWQQHEGYGVFGQVMWSPIPEFDFLLGMRYQIDKIDARMVNGNDSAVHTDRTFLYSFTPTWNITPNQHLYFTLAKNYAPSIIFGFGNLSVVNKERGLNYELGYYGRWFDDRLSTSVALFVNDIKDRQVENPATYMYANLGRERSKGFEISADYHINNNYLVGASYTKFFPKMVEYIGYPEKEDLYTPYVPLSQGGLYISSKHDTRLGLLRTRLDVKYTGKSYGDTANETTNDNYTLVDMNVSLTRGDHEFTLWGKNIFDKEHYNVTFNYDIFPGKNATYGRGRTFGFDYKYRF